MPPPRGRRPFDRWVFLWNHRYTPAGKAIFVVVAVLTMTIAGITNVRPIHGLFFVLFAVVAVDWLVGFRPRVEVDRRLPERIATGAEVTAVARVKNVGRRAAHDLALIEWRPPPTIRHVGEPPYHDRLPAGETATLTRRLVATRRGIHDLRGPAIASAFPFGLYHKIRKIRQPARLIVYPRFEPLDTLDLPVGRKHQPGGLQLLSEVGDSEEFLSNREYRTGDRLRDIDHRAWARRGAPIVREFQQEYLTRIALIVDTHTGRRDRRRARDFEASISVGAAVADYLSRQEYVVDVFAAGPDLYHFQAGRSLAYLDDILDVLACVETCPTSPFERIGPNLMQLVDEISTAVVLLLDFDDERRRFLSMIEDRNVALKVFVIRSTEPTVSPAGFTTEGGPVRVLTADDIERGLTEL